MPPVDTTGPRADVEALAAAAAQGDRDALGELYERYADAARGVAYLAVNCDSDLARDITGEAWVRVGKGIHTYQARDGAGFVAWLMTIVRNVAKDHYRKQATRRETLTADMLLLDVEADTADSQAEIMERRERAQAVVEALRKLTCDQRECLLWLFWCGLSVAETARLMGRNPNAVGVLRHRALTAMRRALPAGVSDAGTNSRVRTQRAPAKTAAGEAGSRC